MTAEPTMKTLLPLFILLMSGLLSSCNDEPQIPPGSKIVIFPGNKTIAISEYRDSFGNCVYSPDYFQDVPVQMTLLNDLDQPVSGAELSLFLDYSYNTFSGRPVMSLHRDRNGNGVVDTQDQAGETLGSVADEVFKVRTDDYTGTASVLVRLNLSCAYRGNLYVFSGSAAGAMELAIESQTTILETPDMSEPVPQDPIPEDPLPQDPIPEDPLPQDPMPQNPSTEEPSPEQQSFTRLFLENGESDESGS